MNNKFLHNSIIQVIWLILARAFAKRIFIPAKNALDQYKEIVIKIKYYNKSSRLGLVCNKAHLGILCHCFKDKVRCLKRKLIIN